jgi:flagellar motor switch protein FliG
VATVQATNQLTGPQKAAMLLISLGPDVAVDVLKQLQEDQIERLTREISEIRAVPAEIRAELFAECYSLIQMDSTAEAGGKELARHVLVRALGERRAEEILERVANAQRVNPFEFIESADPLQIANFIQDEHAQTSAVVLSHLSAHQAAAVLSNLEPALQQDIAERIARLDRIAPEILSQIEQGLQVKFSTVLSQDYSQAGGPDFLVKVLTQVDRPTERSILEFLEERDSALANEIRGKMFVFEDIVLLDNHSIQRLIQELDRRDLALAIKGATGKVRDLIYRNMSTRAREMLEEEVDLLGPVRLSAVEQAQHRISETVRRLEAEDEIFISRGQDEIIG